VFRFYFGVATPSVKLLGRVSCWSLLGVRPGLTHIPNLYFISSCHHIKVLVLLRSYLSSNIVVVHRFVTPPRDQYNFDCVLPILACVLECACRDKPLWRGHSCVTGDNQRSSNVVTVRIRLLGALDHQRQDLHPIKLSYLTEDRALPSNNRCSCS
jgi:hypothetical protein